MTDVFTAQSSRLSELDNRFAAIEAGDLEGLQSLATDFAGLIDDLEAAEYPGNPELSGEGHELLGKAKRSRGRVALAIHAIEEDFFSLEEAFADEIAEYEQLNQRLTALNAEYAAMGGYDVEGFHAISDSLRELISIVESSGEYRANDILRPLGDTVLFGAEDTLAKVEPEIERIEADEYGIGWDESPEVEYNDI